MGNHISCFQLLFVSKNLRKFHQKHSNYPINLLPFFSLLLLLLFAYAHPFRYREKEREYDQKQQPHHQYQQHISYQKHSNFNSKYSLDLEHDHALPTSAPNADILKSNSNPTYPNPNRHHNHGHRAHLNSTPSLAGRSFDATHKKPTTTSI